MKWTQQPSIALDIETTGTDVETARIVTAAVIHMNAGKVVSTWHALADPGVEIPAEATAVHGISTEHAREHGRPAGVVMTELFEQLSSRGKQTPLVVMNAPFDLTVLEREAHRHGLTHLMPDGYPGLVIDPLVIARHLHRYERGPKQLGTLCERYGISLERAHTAEADALAAGLLAHAICSRGRVQRRAWNLGMVIERARLKLEWARVRRSAAALTAAQRRWDLDWRAGMSRFMERRGKPEAAADFAAGGWPLIYPAQLQDESGARTRRVAAPR